MRERIREREREKDMTIIRLENDEEFIFETLTFYKEKKKRARKCIIS